jgi:autotransporter-associated beta strand protein
MNTNIHNLSISNLRLGMLALTFLTASVISTQAAGVTRTLTTSGASNWTTATWTNGAPDSTSAGDVLAYNPATTATSTITLNTTGVVFGAIRGNSDTAVSGGKGWTINSGSGTSFTLDNTGGLINPFGNFNASIAGAANGSLLTINPNIVIQNTDLSIGATQNTGVIVNGNITASSARNLVLVNNSNSSGGTIQINGSIGATGSAIAILTSHTTNNGFSFPITISGAIGSNVVSLTHNAATDLNISYATTTSELINNATPVSLGYGARYTQLNNTAFATPTTETVNSFGLAGGQSTLTLSGGANNTYQQLDIGTFSRSNNATALVRGTNLGLAAGAAVGNRILIGSGLVQIGTNTSSLGAGAGGSDKQLTIVPYFIGSSAVSGVGTNFLTLDTNGTTGGLRLLGTNEQTTVALAVSGDNVSTTGAVSTTGSKTYNSLRLTGTSASSLAGDNTGTLTITSGALASTMTTATGNFNLSGFTGIVFGTTGANEAVITNTNVTSGGTLTISSPISTASLGGGLTKAGLGTVILAAANTYTGPTTINQSILQVGDGTTGSLNSTGTITTAAGDASNTEARRGELSLNLANNGVLANTIVNNGAISKTVGANVNVLSGGISGAGAVTVNVVGGTLAFSGTQKTNTAASTINNGALRLAGDVHSTTAAINLAPTDNSGAAILQLRADADTTFQSAGVTYVGNTAARTATIDVDQINSGNNSKILTIGGNFTINGYQAAVQTLNVTGSNGYGLALGNLDLIPGSTTNTAPQINVTAPGGLSIASMSIGNSSGGSTGANFTGTGNTVITGNLSRVTTSRSMSLTQSGAGSLTLGGSAITSATSNQAGYNFNLSNGRLNVNHVDALGVTAGSYHRLTVSGGAVLDNTSAGDLALNGRPAVFIDGDFTFGATRALNLGANGAGLGNTGAANKTITVNGTTNALTLGNVTNGSAGNALTKAGTGTLVLSGTAYHTGGTTVTGGTLEVNGGLVTGSTTNGTTVAPGNTDLTIAGITSTAGLRVGQSVSGAGIPAGAFITTIVNGTSIRISQGTLSANTATPLTFSSGSGLGTGAVAVNGGTLLVNSTGNINSVSGVTVNTGGNFKYNSSTAYTAPLTVAGGTVSGTGTLNVDLALNNIADTLSPGNSPGILPLATSQNWSAFTYEWEVNNWVDEVAGTNFDQITIAGSLTLNNSNLYAFDVLSLLPGNTSGAVSNFAETDQSWIVLTTTGGITGFNASNWTVDTSGFTNSEAGAFTLTQAGNNLVLNYGVIPEPSTYAMLMGGLGLLAFLRRRKQA